MSDVDDTDASDEAARDERERIRERKRRRLRERLEGGDARDGTAGSDANGGGDAGVTEAPTEPVDVSGPEALQTLVDDHDVDVGGQRRLQPAGERHAGVSGTENCDLHTPAWGRRDKGRTDGDRGGVRGVHYGARPPLTAGTHPSRRRGTA